jgi:hypothetical protein
MPKLPFKIHARTFSGEIIPQSFRRLFLGGHTAHERGITGWLSGVCRLPCPMVEEHVSADGQGPDRTGPCSCRIAAWCTGPRSFSDRFKAINTFSQQCYNALWGVNPQSSWRKKMGVARARKIIVLTGGWPKTVTRYPCHGIAGRIAVPCFAEKSMDHYSQYIAGCSCIFDGAESPWTSTPVHLTSSVFGLASPPTV